MSDGANGTIKDDFLDELERGVRDIIKSKESKPSEKIQALNAGVKVAAIRHKVMGGDGEKGFFDK